MSQLARQGRRYSDEPTGKLDNKNKTTDITEGKSTTVETFVRR